MTDLKNAMSIQAFYEALEAHDWFFGYSEDPRVNRQGEASFAALEEAARVGGEAFQLLMAEYSKHCFTGKPWNTPKHPKPPAPGSVSEVNVMDRSTDTSKARLEVAPANAGRRTHRAEVEAEGQRGSLNTAKRRASITVISGRRDLVARIFSLPLWRVVWFWGKQVSRAFVASVR
jgi:hypothetical protein